MVYSILFIFRSKVLSFKSELSLGHCRVVLDTELGLLMSKCNELPVVCLHCRPRFSFC